MAWERIMSAHITLQAHAANYLSERRRLGFALRRPGYSVTSFARYVDAVGDIQKVKYYKPKKPKSAKSGVNKGSINNWHERRCIKIASAA